MHRSDFRELVGVSSWMWVVVIVLVLVDGYLPAALRGLKLLNTYIAIIVCVIVGTKLMYVFRTTVTQVLKKINKHNGGKMFKNLRVSEDDLEILQDATISDQHMFDDVQVIRYNLVQHVIQNTYQRTKHVVGFFLVQKPFVLLLERTW